MSRVYGADVMIHPTAIVEPDVEIGPGTKIWDHAHIRKNARIGRECIIGEKTYIAYDVVIGNFVKINAMVYIPTAVTIEDFVMVSAGTVFTNDKLPRAFCPDLSGLAPSVPTEGTLPTLIRRGATIGANATIGCGIEIGRFAMIGMGSVVTKSVLDFHLVYGNPGRHQGYVCVCGDSLGEKAMFTGKGDGFQAGCRRCGRRYQHLDSNVIEVG